MNFLKQQSRCWRKRDSLANCWPKSPFWPAVGRKVPLCLMVGRKVPLRPTGGRQGDTFDFSALGCIVSEFAIKIIIVSKKIELLHPVVNLRGGMLRQARAPSKKLDFYFYYFLGENALQSSGSMEPEFDLIKIQFFMFQKILKKNIHIFRDIKHMCVNFQDETP